MEVGSERCEHLFRLHDLLKSERMLYDEQWQEVVDYGVPNAGDFTVKSSPGEKRGIRIFDTLMGDSLEKFTAWHESLSTPRSQVWHRVKAETEDLENDADVTRWFEEVNRVLFQMRTDPRANYYGQIGEIYRSRGAFGNGSMYVEEVPTGTLYRACPVQHVWISLDHHRIVDTIFYEYKLTAKAAVQKWGREMLPEELLGSLESNPFREYDFVHVVGPRLGVNWTRLQKSALPIESVDLSVTGKCLVDEGGFHEMAYLYTRYEVMPGEVYGRGPAMNVLPSVKTLNEMMRIHLTAGHRVAEPPLLLQHDGLAGLGGRRPKLNPGGLNWGGLGLDGKPRIVPLTTDARLDLTDVLMDRVRQMILSAFKVNLFDILTDRPRQTATEVLERAREKGILVGPLIGQFQSDFLAKQITREFGIARRQGRIPLPPQRLIDAGFRYDVTYETDVTRYQKAQDGLAVIRTIETAAPLIQLDPSLIDVFKGPETVQYLAQVNGVPPKLIRSLPELERMRAAQAAEREKAEAIEAAVPASQAVANVAKAAQMGAEA